MLRENNKSFPDNQIPAGKEEHVIVLPANDKYYTFIQTQNEVKLNLNFSKHILITLFICVFLPLDHYSLRFSVCCIFIKVNT